MTEMVSVDKNYSTTRLLTRVQPSIKNQFEDRFESTLFFPQSEGRQGEGGLRTQGYFKISLFDKPLITIVTVVYNGEQFLEETIQSIINQKYENVEYIIVDGGSTDGTLDIIRRYEHVIDYWISEKDQGIYYAMNKGLSLATGDWINFMNAGDKLLTMPDFNEVAEDITLLYGKTKLGDRKVLRCRKKLNFVNFSFGMVVCHQACFYVKRYYQTNYYDCSFRICADQRFTAEALMAGSALFVNTVICRYIDGGFSAQQDNSILIERLRLNKEMGFKAYPVFLSYIRAKLVSVREYLLRKFYA